MSGSNPHEQVQDGPQQPGGLHELSPEECWSLAASRGVCRIGWTSAGGPAIVPVNHVVHEGTVWARTSARSHLTQEVDESPVAIEMDDVDEDAHVGWSVLLRGTAHVHYHEDEVPEAVRSHHTWAPGARPMWLSLTPSEITGRRVG